MIFFKYTILFLIFIITAMIGNIFSKKYRNRVNELKSFKEAFNILESKIRFTYEPIGDIFEEISILFESNKISSIFLDAKKYMKTLDFKSSWDKSIDNNRKCFDLTNEDISTIKKLGNMLGKTDIQGQLNEIKLNMNFLDIQIAYAEEERKKNEKMYKTLGTIFGLAIIIILI